MVVYFEDLVLLSLQVLGEALDRASNGTGSADMASSNPGECAGPYYGPCGVSSRTQVRRRVLQVCLGPGGGWQGHGLVLAVLNPAMSGAARPPHAPNPQTGPLGCH
jgi:hypothetical protein